MDPFGLPADFVLPNSTEIDTIVPKAQGLNVAFDALGNDIESRISARGEELLADYSKDLAGLGMSPVEMQAINKANEARVGKEAERFREGLMAFNGPQIDDQLRQLNTLNDRLTGLLKVYPSPQALLSTQHLGDPARTEYSSQVANASTAEVATLGRLAIATQNRALAAAVQGRIDAMPKDARPFTANEFAQQIVGKEHARFKLAADKVNNAFQNVINRKTELTKGKPFLHGRLKSALRTHALAKAQGDE